jgi:hypothetical protein
MAPVFIGWAETLFQNYQFDGFGGRGGHWSAQWGEDAVRAV